LPNKRPPETAAVLIPAAFAGGWLICGAALRKGKTAARETGGGFFDTGFPEVWI
jgi:hypothetical protein